jgi:hypothetical protein
MMNFLATSSTALPSGTKADLANSTVRCMSCREAPGGMQRVAKSSLELDNLEIKTESQLSCIYNTYRLG